MAAKIIDYKPNKDSLDSTIKDVIKSLSDIMETIDQKEQALLKQKEEKLNNFSTLKNLKKQHDETYQNKSRVLVGSSLNELEKQNEYNNILYNVESKRYQLNLNSIDSTLSYFHLFMDRCIKYNLFLQALSGEKEYPKLQSYYNLINAIHREYVSKLTDGIDKLTDKLELDESYKDLKKFEYSKNLSFTFLTEDNVENINNKIEEEENKKNTAIQSFADQDPNLNDIILDKDLFLKKIENLVKKIYGLPELSKKESKAKVA